MNASQSLLINHHYSRIESSQEQPASDQPAGRCALASSSCWAAAVDACSGPSLSCARAAPQQHQTTAIADDPSRRIATIPNALTAARIASVPFISYLMVAEQHKLACALFVAAAVTDALDGAIARRWPSQVLSHPLQPFYHYLKDTFTIHLADGNLNILLLHRGDHKWMIVNY